MNAEHVYGLGDGIGIVSPSLMRCMGGPNGFVAFKGKVWPALRPDMVAFRAQASSSESASR